MNTKFQTFEEAQEDLKSARYALATCLDGFTRPVILTALGRLIAEQLLKEPDTGKRYDELEALTATINIHVSVMTLEELTKKGGKS